MGTGRGSRRNDIDSLRIGATLRRAYVEAVTQRGFGGTFAQYVPRFFGSLAEFSWTTSGSCSTSSPSRCSIVRER